MTTTVDKNHTASVKDTNNHPTHASNWGARGVVIRCPMCLLSE